MPDQGLTASSLRPVKFILATVNSSWAGSSPRATIEGFSIDARAPVKARVTIRSVASESTHIWRYSGAAMFSSAARNAVPR